MMKCLLLTCSRNGDEEGDAKDNLHSVGGAMKILIRELLPRFKLSC